MNKGDYAQHQHLSTDLNTTKQNEDSGRSASVFELTIIVPVFNEAECLPRLQEELSKFISAAPVRTQVLFVNDGSTDETQAILEDICDQRKDFHYITFHSNQGLSAAIKAGIDHAQTELIGYIDADLQTTPMDFLKLLEFIPEYDLVTGIRVKRNDTIVKRASSFIANTIRRMMIHDGIVDTGCPLKIMKTRYAKTVPFFIGMHRFIPALFLMIGAKVKQVPVQHFPRIAGEAKFNVLNRMIKPFIDTLAFRWMMKRYIHYQIVKEA